MLFEPSPNQIGAVAKDNHELIDTAVMRIADDVLDDRLAKKRHQWLRQTVRHRPESGSIAGGEYETLPDLSHANQKGS